MSGYQPKDYYFKKAKKENFLARSVFKLEEIDLKYKILSRGNLVLDLGASPGSWTQYVAKKIGESGKIIAIDLQPLELKASTIPHLKFFQKNIEALWTQSFSSESAQGEQLALWGVPEGFDVILSDMAPKTTGIVLTDQAKSLELCEMALSMADKTLKNHGKIVMKLFHSGDFQVLKEKIKKQFTRFEALKPQSTRKISKEIFLIGIDYKKRR